MCVASDWPPEQEIIAEPDSCEEPVSHLAGPRQSVGPRWRPRLPSDSGRAGSLALFRFAYANAAARTESRQKVLEITVIRRVLLSFYGDTPHFALAAAADDAPGGNFLIAP